MSVHGTGAEFDLHLAFGKLQGSFEDRLARILNALQEHTVLLANSGDTSTTAVTTIPLRPQIPVGRVYDVRMISFAPNPVTTAVACNLYVFAGSPSAGAVGSQYRDCLLSGNIPNTVTYGRGEFPLRGGDHLYVVLGTTVAATNVNITAVCGDNEDRP